MVLDNRITVSQSYNAISGVTTSVLNITSFDAKQDLMSYNCLANYGGGTTVSSSFVEVVSNAGKNIFISYDDFL